MKYYFLHRISIINTSFCWLPNASESLALWCPDQTKRPAVKPTGANALRSFWIPNQCRCANLSSWATVIFLVRLFHPVPSTNAAPVPHPSPKLNLVLFGKRCIGKPFFCLELVSDALENSSSVSYPYAIVLMEFPEWFSWIVFPCYKAYSRAFLFWRFWMQNGDRPFLFWRF